MPQHHPLQGKCEEGLVEFTWREEGETEMAIWGPSKIIRLERWFPCSPGWSDSTTAAAAGAAAAGVWKWKEKSRGGCRLGAVNCSPLQMNPDVQQQQQQTDDSEVLKDREEVSI